MKLVENARSACCGHYAKSCTRQTRDEEKKGEAEEDEGATEEGDSDNDGESEEDEVELDRPLKKKKL